MRNLKRMGAMLMALVLAFSLSVTAFAAVEDTGFSDVARGRLVCRGGGVCPGQRLDERHQRHHLCPQ